MTRPARFLFTAWPFQGHVFPQVALAHELRRRGHECAFYTGRRLSEVVRADGFTCFPFHHLDEDRLDAMMAARPAEPWQPRNVLPMGRLFREWLLETIPRQLEDLDEILPQWRPDVIGTDPTMWGSVLVLHESVPIDVAICSFIPACALPGPDAPPFGPGLRRPTTMLDRLSERVVRQGLALTGRLSRRMVNEIRRGRGLPPIDVTPAEYTGRMPLYLVPCTRAFDYDRRDLPPSVHYVGPYLWNQPRTEASPLSISALRRDRPCVHVTEGTMHVHAALVLPAAIEGLADLPMTVVATTGGARTVADLGVTRVADNIHVERWVSHHELLPIVDVMVTTGGAGSVLAALAAGVPLVLVPTEWDKPEIARRVEASGAGLTLHPRDCTPARLRACVEQVLATPSYRQRARELAASFAETGGAAEAADLLLGLARRRIDGAA